MLKKFLILIAIAIMAVTGLTACGGNDAPAGGDEAPQENPEVAV